MRIEIICDHGPSGNCPVQAEGSINGYPFYFRARGGTWSVRVSRNKACDPFECDAKDVWFFSRDYVGIHHKEEVDLENPVMAGWAEPEECKRFIEIAAVAFCKNL